MAVSLYQHQVCVRRGDIFYLREEWACAIASYTEALQACAGAPGKFQLLSTILSNRSAACAKLGQWQESLQDAEQVWAVIARVEGLDIVIFSLQGTIERH